jgi:hypothetical protein
LGRGKSGIVINKNLQYKSLGELATFIVNASRIKEYDSIIQHTVVP